MFYGCFLFFRKFQEICIFKKRPKNQKWLQSRFSAVFWQYRFPGFSWNFTISCTRFLAFQEGENSVRYLPTIDNQYTRRTRFLDQPFGLGDSWSAGKLMTFQALFSHPAELGPYIVSTQPKSWPGYNFRHCTRGQSQTRMDNNIPEAVIISRRETRLPDVGRDHYWTASSRGAVWTRWTAWECSLPTSGSRDYVSEIVRHCPNLVFNPSQQLIAALFKILLCHK